MKFPFQHMHWTQHKSHNREFNLKLIYWWNVIRIPMKTNKSTWHWEKKINWGRWKLPATAIRSRGKSYTNWSASAKPEWNVPSAILDSEMKSFEVKMLMVANICSFHKKQTPDFELWNPAVASCFHFPSFCKSTKYLQGTEQREVASLWFSDQTSLTQDLDVSPFKVKERETRTYCRSLVHNWSPLC